MDVWNDNFEEEMEKIRDVVEDFPWIGMDTEFPGIVYTPNSYNMREYDNYEYKKIAENVNNLKII